MATVTLKRSYYASTCDVPPLQHSVPELLDIRGDTDPDKEAYVIRDIGVPREAITFGQLKLRTQQLAAGLIKRGINKGERIALICPSSIDYVVCEYAVARTGAIVVRVQSSFKTGEDLKQLLRKSGARWLIAHPGQDGCKYELLKKICPLLDGHDQGMNLKVNDLPDLEAIFMLGDKPFDGTVPLKSIISEEFDLDGLNKRQAMMTNDDVQAINTTSGSTGVPKLVAQPYAYGINGWRNALMRNGVTEKDVYLSDRPMTYGGGMTGPALGMGFTMVYVVTESTVSAGLKGAEFMLQCSEEEKCTVMMMFPYLLMDFLHLEKEGKFHIGKIRMGIISGQSMNKALFGQCLKLIPVLISMYGSTEADVPVGALLKDSLEKRVSTTGIAAEGEVKIVDEDDVIVPVNTTGELCLRNTNLLVKYWDDDSLTKQAKTPSGWFLTGDMAMMDSDGYILVLGRKQEVISRATIKIYPVVIENVIIKYPKVALVTVIGVPDVRLHEEICACVVVNKNQTLTESELREYCDSVFAEDLDGMSYTPKYFVFFDSLPAGSTGKVDRRAVRKMAVGHLTL